MSTRTENVIHVQSSSVEEQEVAQIDSAVTSKKTFVEPQVSFPVDVLESTTFFQFTESGATN